MKAFSILAIALFLFTASCTNDGADNPANSAESPEGTGPDVISSEPSSTPAVATFDTTVSSADTTAPAP